MVTGSSSIDFLLENEPHAYDVATTTTFFATSLSFDDVPLLPPLEPSSLILSLVCVSELPFEFESERVL
ncbi:hypothetical protein TSUD_378220 [Trifolium subterraneum]|uniref:Uncharacterized protein n=1 Tax=Trifolium subterraneum TaxID=3900 RepID=A0A2Z6NKT4_TRISU|nr:hypothetical protein TSUD_378220 [Trifolium subterraneum]